MPAAAANVAAVVVSAAATELPPAKRPRGRPRGSTKEAAAAAAGQGPPSTPRAKAVIHATAAAAAAAAVGPAAVADAALEDAALASPPPSTAARKKKSARAAASPSNLVLSNRSALEFKAQRIAELLGRLYPNPPVPLDHASNFQLLCAVLLSAQTTDKKVNECTPALFRLAPDAASMAAAELADIGACIRQLGLAPTKARNLKAMSQLLVELHGGEVPASMEALEALPGVGHKTASVVMCQAFGQDAMPVDTHIHRLSQRWGLTDGRSVEQTEADLKLLFPQPLWKDLHLQIIFFGRERCAAQRHDPLQCPICSWAAVPPYDRAGVSPAKAGKPPTATAGKAAPAAAKKRAAAAAAALADVAALVGTALPSGSTDKRSRRPVKAE